MTKRGAWARFLAGVGLLAALVVVVAPRIGPQPKALPGWQTIRPPKDVMALLEVGGVVWSGGRDGVVTIDRDSGAVQGPPAAGVKLAYVTSMAVDGGGGVWIGHGHGVSRFDGAGWQTWTAADGLPGDQVLAVICAREGEIWVGTTAGAARYADGAWIAFTRQDGLGSDAVSVIFQDSRGRLWFGNGYDLHGGLTMLDELGWRPYSTADGLAHNAVNAILEDRQGALWFGAGFGSRGGASRFDGSSWRTLTEEDGLAGAKVRSVFQDSDQVLWFGSEYDGLACNDGQAWQLFTPREGLAGWEVKVMLEDSQGNLWLGTENGISRIAPGYKRCGKEQTP